MTLRSVLPGALGAFLLAGLASVGAGYSVHTTQRLRAAQDSVLVARADARRSLTAAHAAQVHAAVADSVARAAQAQAAQHAAQARTALDRAATARAAYTGLAATVPDTCRQVVARADSALSADSVALVQRAEEARSLQEALQSTIGSRDSLRVALGGIMASTSRLDASTAILARRTEPSGAQTLLARLTPKAGLGVAVGINPLTYHPSITVGITLAWSR